jgi:hypothetical protein
VQLCVGAASADVSWTGRRTGRWPSPRVPHLASRWAWSRNLSTYPLELGSTEAWVPDLADVIVDVVETGET